jgi:hypothetical protein
MSGEASKEIGAGSPVNEPSNPEPSTIMNPKPAAATTEEMDSENTKPAETPVDFALPAKEQSSLPSADLATTAGAPISALAKPSSTSEAALMTSTSSDAAETGDEVRNPDTSVTIEPGSALVLTLLLPSSGARHPYKIDEKYLMKRNIPVPGTTESGKKDPFSISVYTLKELILREWRDEWEPKPSSPSSIRLIHFGRLLDDKITLKGMLTISHRRFCFLSQLLICVQSASSTVKLPMLYT